MEYGHDEQLYRLGAGLVRLCRLADDWGCLLGTEVMLMLLLFDIVTASEVTTPGSCFGLTLRNFCGAA